MLHMFLCTLNIITYIFIAFVFLFIKFETLELPRIVESYFQHTESTFRPTILSVC